MIVNTFDIISISLLIVQVCIVTGTAAYLAVQLRKEKRISKHYHDHAHHFYREWLRSRETPKP
jgi:hypothetical protein